MLIYKNLILQEQQWQASRRLKAVLEKLNGGGSMKVSVWNEGELVELTTKEDIEWACLNGNRNKFLQIGETPAMIDQLAVDLSKYSKTPQYREILQGRYEILAEIDQYTRKYIKEL